MEGCKSQNYLREIATSVPGSGTTISKEQGASLHIYTCTCIFVSIVSVYAPTLSEVKEEFFSDLQATIGGIDEHDVVLVVWDFNARVGSSDRGRVDAAWDGARGFRGVGKLKEAGVELLSFCSVNELAIMNTFFEEKSIYKLACLATSRETILTTVRSDEEGREKAVPWCQCHALCRMLD